MRRFFERRGARLKLSQNLGAFGKPDGDISPLYVFFDVANEGREPAEIVRLNVVPKDEEGPLGGLDLAEGRPLPVILAPGESTRFQVRAKVLARALKDAGYGGTPKATFVVRSGGGEEHRRRFRLRVDEYLALKDE